MIFAQVRIHVVYNLAIQLGTERLAAMPGEDTQNH